MQEETGCLAYKWLLMENSLLFRIALEINLTYRFLTHKLYWNDKQVKMA